MSKKSNAQAVEQTAGKLSYLKQWDLTVSDSGTGSDNIDFTAETWEASGATGPDHLTITNNGSNRFYFRHP